MEILIGIFGMIYPPVNENIAMVCYGIDGPVVDDLPFFLPGDFPVPHFKFGFEQFSAEPSSP